jgi:hypothetical protein
MVGHVLAVIMASSERAPDHPAALRTRCAT